MNRYLHKERFPNGFGIYRIILNSFWLTIFNNNVTQEYDPPATYEALISFMRILASEIMDNKLVILNIFSHPSSMT